MSEAAPLNEFLEVLDDYPDIQAGDIYEHYKGGYFKIVGKGILDTTGEPKVAFYFPMTDKLCIQSIEKFFGDAEVDGLKVPRYTFTSHGNI